MTASGTTVRTSTNPAARAASLTGGTSGPACAVDRAGDRDQTRGDRKRKDRAQKTHPAIVAVGRPESRYSLRDVALDVAL